MTMTNPYCSVSQVESYLLTDISVSFEPFVERYIEAASRFIDNYTQKQFGGTSETRYYFSNDPRELCFDDVYVISSIQMYDYTGSSVQRTISSDEYDLFPLNNTEPNGFSKYMLRMKPNKVGLVMGRKIAITGNFGISSDASGSVPKDIETACVILVAETVRQGRDGGLPSSESLGEYSVNFQKILETDLKIVNVRAILDKYKILTVG
jgi:hypothetical protein